MQLWSCSNLVFYLFDITSDSVLVLSLLNILWYLNDCGCLVCKFEIFPLGILGHLVIKDRRVKSHKGLLSFQQLWLNVLKFVFLFCFCSTIFRGMCCYALLSNLKMVSCQMMVMHIGLGWFLNIMQTIIVQCRCC